MVTYKFLFTLLENILIENKTYYCELTKINFETLSINISKLLKVELTGSDFPL